MNGTSVNEAKLSSPAKKTRFFFVLDCASDIKFTFVAESGSFFEARADVARRFGCEPSDLVLKQKESE